MAQRHAAALVHHPTGMNTEAVLAQAAQLITDCVHYLDLPVLAAQVALTLHEQVERCAAWGRWTRALDALLALPDEAYAIHDRIHLLHNRNHVACELGDLPTAATVVDRALQLAATPADQALMALSLHQYAKVLVNAGVG